MPAPAPQQAAAPSTGTGLTFFGYGELNYSRPRDSAGTTADVGRAVLGWGYHFSDTTRMAAEFEVEHAVSSSSDQGEAEIEQLYVEHDINPSLSAKAGLFLMPVGLLNESHEPTRYFGVFRNQVETAIIPTTWRELGVGLQGTTGERPALEHGPGHRLLRPEQVGTRPSATKAAPRRWDPSTRRASSRSRAAWPPMAR